MKRNRISCIWLALWAVMLTGPAWAQKNLEAVIDKYKNLKSTDINVITQKDPKTLKLRQIVTTITIYENPSQVVAEVLAAFEKDKPGAYQTIDVREKGRMQPFYNFLIDNSDVSYGMDEGEKSVTITKIERRKEQAGTHRKIE